MVLLSVNVILLVVPILVEVPTLSVAVITSWNHWPFSWNIAPLETSLVVCEVQVNVGAPKIVGAHPVFGSGAAFKETNTLSVLPSTNPILTSVFISSNQISEDGFRSRIPLKKVTRYGVTFSTRVANGCLISSISAKSRVKRPFPVEFGFRDLLTPSPTIFPSKRESSPSERFIRLPLLFNKPRLKSIDVW